MSTGLDVAAIEKCCWSIKLEGFLLSLILRLLRLTWKVRFKGREHLDQCYNTRNNFLICFWHGKYVPIFSLLEGLEACVISSQSKRGSVIAEICKNFGFQTTQISDQAGSGSLRHLSELLHNARMGGIAVDGPLGPRNQVKPGVIWMASAFGFDLLPVSVGSSRAAVLKKRWDRMEIPLPFATVCLSFGKPIKVPARISKGQTREWADHFSEAITTLGEEARNLACGSDK